MTRCVASSLLVALLLGLGSARPAGADDVPEGIRELYAEACGHEAAGDLKKAYSVLSKARQQEPLSVDFWELYVRVWRGLDKEERILWDKIIGKLEKKHRASPVFCLLRARLAEENAERCALLREAVAKAPDAVEPRLELAKAVFTAGDEIEAELILDALLEAHPGLEEALVTRGELDLEGGRSLSALAWADEKLETHDLPGLHDLRARALVVASENDASRLDEAEDAARKAMAAREDPRYVRTLVDILDRRGRLSEAVKLLDEHYERTHALVLASKLGEYAFRKGDYEKALRGLIADPAPSTRVLKAMAACHGRLGDVDAMRRVTKRLAPRLAEDEPLWIARLELSVGEAEAALKTLAEKDGDDATWYRLWAHALLGDVDAARSIADERARQGGRFDEEYLVALLQARLVQRLGAKAKSTFALLRRAEVDAAKASTPGASVDASEPAMKARTVEFMERAISYRRTLGGRWFTSPMGEDDITIGMEEGNLGRVKIRFGVRGCADCPLESTRWFWFNTQEIDPASFPENADPETVIEEVLRKVLGGVEADWKTAEGAFQEGCAALVEEQWSAGRAALERAAQEEPAWGRARLFAAVASVLGNGDAGAAAREARESLKDLADDFDGHRLVVLLQVLAGQDATATAEIVARKEEAHCTRRLDAL